MENFQNYLFRLKDLGGCGPDEVLEKSCAPVLITSDVSSEYPTPCPGIMRQKDIEMALHSEAPKGKLLCHAMVPFSPRKGIEFRQRIGVSSSLIPLNPKQLIDGHRIEDVDVFPIKSLREISAEAEERGAITFIVKDVKQAIKTTRELPVYFSKAFKFFENFKYKTSCYGREYSHDPLALFVTLMDLRYCIPIYNARKVDGIGVMVGVFYYKSTKEKQYLRCYDIYSAVASNLEENIFKIDGGSQVNSRNGFPSALTDHMVIALESEERNKSSKEKMMAAEPVPGKPAPKKGKPKLRAKVAVSSYTYSGNSSTSSTSNW